MSRARAWLAKGTSRGEVDASDTAPADAHAPLDVTIVGITGTTCRAAVSAWGDVTPLGATTTDALSWFVAADDRWHVPAQEATVRQRRIEGAPVVETRIRVVDGDAVQRVWSVADGGGLTIVEVENESPLPFAVAFAGGDIITERPPADVPVRGIDLPPGAFVLPVGHRSTVRVAVAHDPAAADPAALRRAAPAMAVVRGWHAVTDRASRLVLPDEAAAEAVTAARCDLLLAGPVDPAADPLGFLSDVTELVRLGEPGDVWMPEIVEPIAAIARQRSTDVDRVLAACCRMALESGDDRAAADLGALVTRRQRDGHVAAPSVPTPLAAIRRGASAGRFVADVERCLVDGGTLLPAGLPRAWRGANFEVHHLPTGPRSSVSFAVRWHGPRPAVLWEQHGEATMLRADRVDPAWSSDAPAGEALWAAPPEPTRLTLAADLGRNDGGIGEDPDRDRAERRDGGAT